MGMLAANRFTCHWDESGIDPGTGTKSKSDKDLLVVAGYLAHVDEWKNFEKKWEPTVKAANLRDFHMVDFANLNPPYNKWDEPRRDRFIDRLLHIVEGTSRAWVAWVISIDAYMEVIKADNLLEEDIVRAYHICARKCIESVANWSAVARHPYKVLHIFDHGNSAWDSFISTFTDEVLRAYNILRPIAQSKFDIVPLQAADALAHQTARHVELSMGYKMKEPHVLYTKRLWTPPHSGVYGVIDKHTLRRMYREERLAEELRLWGVDSEKSLISIKQRQNRRELLTNYSRRRNEDSVAMRNRICSRHAALRRAGCCRPSRCEIPLRRLLL